MAEGVFTKALELMSQGNIDFTGALDTFKIALLRANGTATFTLDATTADINSAATILTTYEYASTNYPAGGTTPGSILTSRDDTKNKVIMTSALVDFTNLAAATSGSAIITGALLYISSSTQGNADVPVAYYNLPNVTPNGTTLSVGPITGGGLVAFKSSVSTD